MSRVRAVRAGRRAARTRRRSRAEPGPRSNVCPAHRSYPCSSPRSCRSSPWHRIVLLVRRRGERSQTARRMGRWPERTFRAVGSGAERHGPGARTPAAPSRRPQRPGTKMCRRKRRTGKATKSSRSNHMPFGEIPCAAGSSVTGCSQWGQAQALFGISVPHSEHRSGFIPASPKAPVPLAYPLRAPRLGRPRDSRPSSRGSTGPARGAEPRRLHGRARCAPSGLASQLVCWRMTVASQLCAKPRSGVRVGITPISSSAITKPGFSASSGKRVRSRYAQISVVVPSIAKIPM